jgi:hypothetical protein
MSRFTAIPNPPQSDISPWQYSMLNSMKENIELLAGLRGEKDGASQAILKSSVTIRAVPNQQMTRVSAQGAGVVISGSSVPTLSDYVSLVRDVQTLAQDVASLRSTVETLISQLRG